MIAQDRKIIEKDTTRIIFVHMGTEEQALSFFNNYGLPDIARVSDPTQSLYKIFELEKGKYSQLLGWKSWFRGLVGGKIFKYGIGKTVGDPYQMPGVFLIQRGKILKSYRHQTIADNPDYCELAKSEK